MNKILIIAFVFLILLPMVICASQISGFQKGEVYLRAKQLDWDTFYFEPRLNNLNESDVNYIWEFNDGYRYEGREFIRTFKPGEYTVHLTAVDFSGRYYSQTAKLKVKYLSLNNIWFWGILYLIILVLIIYYTFAKLIYWSGERKIKKEAEIFLDQLEKVDFWENLAKAIKSSK